MSIKISRPGMFTTVQDLGRFGYRSVGIGPGGAMDFFAASVANFLVGNDENYPVIEMHFPAAEIEVEEDVLVSITGADFSPTVNDEPARLWRPVLIKKGRQLSFKKYISGARAYLAIAGGPVINKWLKSCSTHTKLKAGGYKGRQLLKDDSMTVNSMAAFVSPVNLPFQHDMTEPVYQPCNLIRCLAGPEWELLNDDSKKIFPHSSFFVSARSDRMGYRLLGTSLDLTEPLELVSSPVDYGTLQLLPSGQLVVLMADHQTTGGYPRIANVITADLPKLAQLPIRSELQFQLTGIENAEEALVSLYRTLQSIKNNCINYYDAYRHQL